ncbi:cation channel sperm-associated auxiliary subunit epsilon-like [Diadema setosum]|uniref:cation channel sperm-associated auxiliary subunit epsilon-like n=1 Tax=Diadema setosum TaxID=31175 RepID=UPI003B3AD655
MTYHLPLIVGVILLHCSVDIAVGSHWRANQEALSNEARLYSTRLPLQVDFFGGQEHFLRWGVPAQCRVANASHLNTRISCKKAGLHEVKLQYLEGGEEKEDSRVLIMKKSPLCYDWYVSALEGNQTARQPSISVRVWIVDPLRMDVDEGKHSANTPSEFSASLSAVFAGKGQMPHLTELNPDPRSSQWEWSDGVFLSQQGFWEFSIDASESNTRTVFVTGKPSIAARGCFIRDTKELIPWPYVDERRELLKGGGKVTLRGQPHISLVVTDPCEPNTAALIMR